MTSLVYMISTCHGCKCWVKVFVSLFKFLSKDSFLFLYRTYIRPHLEYCVPSWSPYLAKDINALEQVQHHATKLVKSLSTLPYEDRLVSFQLQSLYCHRQRWWLDWSLKILNDFTNFRCWSRKFSRGMAGNQKLQPIESSGRSRLL